MHRSIPPRRRPLFKVATALLLLPTAASAETETPPIDAPADLPPQSPDVTEPPAPPPEPPKADRTRPPPKAASFGGWSPVPEVPPTRSSTAPSAPSASTPRVTVLEPTPREDRAEEPLRADDGEPREQWYGWQTLIFDGASLLLLATGLAEESVGYVVVGASTYTFGPPAVHLGHGHVEKALGSLGLRLAPTGLLFLTVACDVGFVFRDRDACGPLAVAFLLSIPVAIAVDAAVLAREDVPAPSPDAPPEPQLGVWVGPWRSATGAPGLGSGMRVSF